MKIIIQVWLFYLFFLPMVSAALQLTPPAFTHITSQKFSDVKKVLSGPLGFKWLATDTGVFRFDGFEFIHYSVEADSTEDVIDIVFDDFGTLWVATYGKGLLYLDKYSKRLIKADVVNEETHNAHILKLYIDSKGALWVGHLDGISKYTIFNSKKLTSIDPSFQIAEEATVWDIYEDSQNQLWIATLKQGVFLHELDSLKTQQITKENTPSLADNIVRSIFESKDGLIWIGTDNGLTVYNPQLDKYKSYWSEKNNERTLSTNAINEIYQDSLGRVWVGTYGAGLNLYHKKSDDFQRVDGNNKHDFFAKVVNFIGTDEQGSLWIGSDAGLFQSTATASVFNHQVWDTESQSLTRTMFQDRSDKLWYGTEQGVIVQDAKLNTARLVSTEIWDALSFYEDEEGHIWITTLKQGLYKINDKGDILAHFNVSNSDIPSNTITKLVVDKKDKNKLWLGLLSGQKKNNGLVSLDLKTTEFKQYAPERFVVDIAKIDNNTLMVASRTLEPAFFDLDTEQFISTDYSGEVKPFIDKLYVDRKNRIWGGTYNSGLWLLDNNTLKWSKVEKVKINHIFGVTEDADGTLWVIGGPDLVAYHPDSQTVLKFDSLDGLKTEGYTDKGAVTVEIDNQERIYLTAHNGISYFSPSVLKTHIESIVQPRPIFTELRIANQVNHSVQTREDQKQLPFEESQYLELTHRDYLFSIRFSGLDFNKPETQQFEYKLEGLDTDWLTASSESRVATYSTLPEGSYMLRVKRANSMEERTLDIKVLPPPWRTWPAYGIYLCIVICLVWIIVFLKQRALKLKANELSKAVNLKTLQLKEANEKLAQKHHVIESLLKEKNNMFTQISHELRTPLTLILSPIEQLLGQVQQSKHVAILAVAKRNTLILKNLVDQLLQLVKLESKPQHTFSVYDVEKSLNAIIASYTPTLTDRGMTLSCSSMNGVYLRLVSDSLEICVSNLLSNAVKFSSEGSEVRVSFQKSEAFFVLTISDDGMGIDARDQAVIFDKFHRLPPPENAELVSGSGIGLSIVQELMLANQGRVKVQSTLGKGSQFSLLFPVECEVASECFSEAHKPSVPAQVNTPLLTPDMFNEFHTVPYSYQEGKLSVLIVEDNTELRGFLQQLLEPSYNCLTASDGLEGIEKSTDSIPDLIITDIMMPKLNGYELTQTLRRNQLTCHIPIIMLTAKSDSESRLEGWKYQADEYIGKPFDNHELILRVENLISIRKMLRQSLGRDLGVARPVLGAENDMMKLDHEFILRFEKIIEEHYQDEAFSRTIAASEMHISERQLNRKLAHLLDHNFSEYLRKYRLRQSLGFINSGLQIAQIAEEVGFSSPSYFSHCFKAEFGKTISQYRKSPKQE
ncbi:hybrid sensor histidine kinase/response regulator transcription factor [Pseudoalteromonas luteoviolacea]|uniref:histidine kinase n=1 Tax=Pseudoalteromonas luteoviolacea S4054 TaxID=1129367 RepID=A0A0F6A616_9GAMM|nr:hybrid sensor histidine kinase/response regulator transcription factor [Pseudoalteromonas luteoviolacea]AOT07561.1 hypothetical protein S4054249_06780 [Pseudoalteromonas luteoviolacea]AOT12477.1 hypothetical protein S40542_06780 [Pseudoalteromonas luteoviolacea]AOT17391.1 hypothetical protein S4054_06780 [Pseudoalteromonas luteoviolacea]KKE81296.1 hypothetical protein N479_22435 [Pseudoalteromonas luteoviolacea S4054]KZN70695.1 hypothetical protein N481_21000 [Pseudoalteromonas luteoviolace